MPRTRCSCCESLPPRYSSIAFESKSHRKEQDVQADAEYGISVGYIVCWCVRPGMVIGITELRQVFSRVDFLLSDFVCSGGAAALPVSSSAEG